MKASKTITSPTTMVIIGNGYDVALNYNTKYSDFYNNCQELSKLVRDGNKLCATIMNEGCNNKSLWSDLECGLFEYSKMLTKQKGENINVANNFHREYDELRNALFNYLKNASQAPVAASNLVLKIQKEWERLSPQYISFNYTSLLAAHINHLNQ